MDEKGGVQKTAGIVCYRKRCGRLRWGPVLASAEKEKRILVAIRL